MTPTSTRLALVSLGGIAILGGAIAVADAPNAFATVCNVSVKATRLTRPAHLQAPAGPLAFTGANVTTAIILAVALLGLGASLVALARRRTSRASAPLLAGLVLLTLVVGGIAERHSASATTATGSACPPAGATVPVTRPVTVDATTVTKPTTTDVAGTGPTTSDPAPGDPTSPQGASTPTPPAALPEAPLPVAVLVAGLVSGGWLLRRRTRHGVQSSA